MGGELGSVGFGDGCGRERGITIDFGVGFGFGIRISFGARVHVCLELVLRTKDLACINVFLGVRLLADQGFLAGEGSGGLGPVGAVGPEGLVGCGTLVPGLGRIRCGGIVRVDDGVAGRL